MKFKEALVLLLSFYVMTGVSANVITPQHTDRTVLNANEVKRAAATAELRKQRQVQKANIGKLIEATENDMKELQDKLEEAEKQKKVNYVYFNPNDVTEVSNISVEAFRRILKSNGRPRIASQAEAFISAEEMYGINAFFLAGIGVAESTDFSSYFARTRNNPFGLGANDSNPNNAKSYSSLEEAIHNLAFRLRSGPKGQQYYVARGNKSIWDIAKVYCSDSTWPNTIVRQIEFWKNY